MAKITVTVPNYMCIYSHYLGFGLPAFDVLLQESLISLQGAVFL